MRRFFAIALGALLSGSLATSPTMADDAADATVFYTAGLQKQQAAYFVQTPEQRNAELTAAAESFRKALVLNPSYFDALIHLANIEAELKQWDKSLAHLETALPLPGVSDSDKAKTQQAIAYVKSQMGPAAPVEKSGQQAFQQNVQSVADGAGAPSLQQSGQQAFQQNVQSVPDGAGAPPLQQSGQQAFQQNVQSVADGAGAPSLQWTTFRDPSEGSFTVQVPAGWKTEGGMTRASAIDCRPWVRVTAPDGSICAFIGDGTICPGHVPNATLTATGFYPGSKYMGGLVLPYIPARQFAEKYAKLKLKKYMPDLQVVQEGYHPDVAQSINGSVGATKSDCASIKIAGTVNGIPATGYYLCATKLTSMAGSSMWWVTYIAGEVSTAQAEPAALPIVLHMIKTFQIDPAWHQQSLATTKAVSENYRATANQISKSISDRYWSQQAANDRFNQSYWNRQAVQDHAADNFSDYMRGQQTVADPTTGTQYKVQQANEHWINPMGDTIMGTTGGAPDTDWRQLNNVP